MRLSIDEVKHVAKLADLTLTDPEVEKINSQLSETLEFVGKLDEIETKDIEDTYSITGLSNVTRLDETESSLTQEQALQNTKNTEKKQFKVKAIFENES